MQTQTIKTNACGSSSVDASTVVLVADAFTQEGTVYLTNLGCVVEYDPSLQADCLREAIEKTNPSVLVVRSTKVTEEMMDASERLTLIIRAGAGYDTIDVGAASARGISVANCPGKNAIAVAELALGLMLNCDRRISSQVADLQNGVWNKKEYSKANGLFGRTIGIVGMGGIGREVITRANSFGMKVIAWSRSLTAERADELGIGWCENLQNLAKMSDIVSVHLASNTNTSKILNADFFNAMKDGAIFINTSRGNVVDEDALYEAAEAKSLRVGLDVYENEPGAGDSSFGSKIASAPFVFGTHHVGASTEQAQEAIASEVVKIVSVFVTEGRVFNCVNLVAVPNAHALLCVRHKNLPGVLAHVFDVLSIANVNVEEMENVMYSGNHAACSRIQLGSMPSFKVIQMIKDNENILSVTLSTKK
ncbi:MAG: hydroxyacid dehydrogenase [Phycisphaerae bacterium]|jgi:D-3-phosphoglycerate dehydrogenase / 2-oxoglutarate reductase|nr:hydroxyacid dehydrogenase [Phycisphaerae bacterium]